MAPAGSSSDGGLLSAEMVGRLGRLALAARRTATARRNGRRRTRRIGSGIETIDLRPYEQGDDPRRIAWHAYARLERLLVRLVADEAPLRLYLVVDESTSMGFGHAPATKLRQAARIAAGFAAVALGGEDRVAVASGSSVQSRAHRQVSGRAGLVRILSALEALSPSGATDVPAAVRSALDAQPGRGLCLILGDLFEPQGLLAGAREARRRGLDVALVEVLSPEEVEPPDLAGVDLEDAETGEVVELHDSGTRERFARALAEHRAAVDEAAHNLDAAVLRATTAEPFEAIVMRALDAGLIGAGLS